MASLLAASCMNLPGGDTPLPLRFDLPVPQRACAATGAPLSLTITEVSPSLDSDRVARRKASTGEVEYLKDVRWVGRSSELVEKALARDLECSGFAVLSGRHRRGEHDQLICELRALNLVEGQDRDQAEVKLSCVMFRAGKGDIAVLAAGNSSVDRWSATQAMGALGEAYRQSADELIDALPRPDEEDDRS